MKLQVRIMGQRISVICHDAVDSETYSFALNKTLTIDSVINNDMPVLDYVNEECSLDFRPQMTKHTFSGLRKGSLSIAYSGELNGWYSFFQEEIYHFSMYNGWYPIGFDVEEEYEVDVYCDDRYELIHGRYMPSKGCWHYYTRGQSFIDCNILLINKQKSYICSSEKVTVRYFDHELDEQVYGLINAYNRICQFYQTIFTEDKTQNSTIVILPPKYPQGGAYQRDRLTVFADIRFPMERITHMLAHEIGHSYSCGADCNTWEDWLNETNAEWCALLFELSYNKPLFERIMNERQTRFHGQYMLKTDGNARPNHVHDTGTMLYYEIYKKYGISGIVTLVTTFDCIECKDTKHFLAALSQVNHPLSEWIMQYTRSSAE